MNKVYLLVTRTEKAYGSDEKTEKLTSESELRNRVAGILAGTQGVMDDDVKLEKIYEVETTHGTIKRLKPELNNMRIVFTIVGEGKVEPL